MKIGLIRSDLSGAGGAERYSLSVLRRLAAAGHETHVFTSRLPGDFPHEITTHLFRPKGRRLPRLLRHAAFENWLLQNVPPQRLDFLLTLERTLPSDIYRAGGGVHRAWRDISLRDTSAPKKLWARFDPAHRQMLRAEAATFEVRNTRVVICNSQMVADEIGQYYSFPLERIKVVPNGVDMGKFHISGLQERVRLRAERGFTPDDFVVLFAGSGFWRKGADIALRIFADWKKQTKRQLKLVFVGRAENESFTALARELGIEGDVLFMGSKPAGEMVAWYQSADLFLFPTRYDPFANACLEANACGVPIITSSRNGFKDHVRAGVNGLVVDEVSAAAQIESFCEHLPAPEAVREAVGNLTLEAHMENLMSVFDFASQFPAPEGLRAHD
jgi:UDP-glucose:(heptosyl)LPS alpha-1,3-glucosyltransferase